ncbi:hypothetical protein NEPAR04_2222 [Nematocida parisii]|nr:hypothetical protein NEPAR04_2222 [Nematocida parisii]KAI5168172.1 hypothetical protein NEIRO02_2444 [Nematocida sp. AWRm79]
MPGHRHRLILTHTYTCTYIHWHIYRHWQTGRAGNRERETGRGGIRRALTHIQALTHAQKPGNGLYWEHAEQGAGNIRSVKRESRRCWYYTGTGTDWEHAEQGAGNIRTVRTEGAGIIQAHTHAVGHAVLGTDNDAVRSGSRPWRY